jgi:hypothetical protein
MILQISNINGKTPEGARGVKIYDGKIVCKSIKIR